MLISEDGVKTPGLVAPVATVSNVDVTDFLNLAENTINDSKPAVRLVFSDNPGFIIKALSDTQLLISMARSLPRVVMWCPMLIGLYIGDLLVFIGHDIDLMQEVRAALNCSTWVLLRQASTQTNLQLCDFVRSPEFVRQHLRIHRYVPQSSIAGMEHLISRRKRQQLDIF